MQEKSKPSGSWDLLSPVWHHLRPNEAEGTGELFQTSLMAALLGGVYEGSMTYGELHRHGDFGLGTFNELDGEMIGFDGLFYQLRSDGSATLVKDEERTPFAVVTFFKPDLEWKVENLTSKTSLLEAIADATDSNLFAAVKITGFFERITTRTVQRQHKPYPPLTDATAHQAETTFDKVSGTLAGFRTPSFAQGLGVSGFHLHFLRGDGAAGGHSLDYQLRAGTVQVQSLHSFHVELPSSKEFLAAKLSGAAIDSQIKISEG